MSDDLNRLRVLATRINDSIVETTAILVDTKDVEMRVMVPGTLADLRRARASLDEQLRLQK